MTPRTFYSYKDFELRIFQEMNMNPTLFILDFNLRSYHWSLYNFLTCLLQIEESRVALVNFREEMPYWDHLLSDFIQRESQGLSKKKFISNNKIVVQIMDAINKILEEETNNDEFLVFIRNH